MEINIDKNIPLLIVEDDPNLRRILSNIAKKIGFLNIREADNGQTAWATIINTEIGLVLTDLNMPMMNGLQLAHMMRNNPKYQHIPILVITAADTKETIIKAGKIGVDGYIIKPFNIPQVIEKIEEVLKKRAEQAGTL